MAERFIEGFDWTTTITELSRKWTSQNEAFNTAINTSTPLTGTGSWRTTATARYLALVLDSQSTWIVGVRIRVNAYEFFLIQLLDGGTVQASLVLQDDGSITARRSTGTILGTSDAGVLSQNTIHHIEIKVTINNTTGTFGVRVDGVSVLDLSSQDTQASGNASADTIRVGNISGASRTLDFDDVHILDGTGSIRNDFLGPQKVYTRLPNGNGNSSQFTGSDGDSTDNYLLVDETDTDDDTTYVESSTVGHRDDYAFENLPVALSQINGVAINALAKKDDAGTRTIDFYTRIGATNYDAALNAALAESYTNHQHIFEQNPDDSADWENADVDGATFGHEVAS